MDRRKFLIGVGGASLGSSALVGSGAFSAMRAERPVSIQVTGDPDALVGLDRCRGSDNAKYAGVDDGGELFVDISEEPNEGDGVNGNSVYLFHEVFQVCNQSDHSICLWVRREDDWPEVDSGAFAGDPRVDFYLGADPDSSILGASNSHELDSGDCVCIGIKTNTIGLTSAEADTILEPVGDDINLRADSECPDGVEDQPGEGDEPKDECVPCSVSESVGTEDFLTIESVDTGNFPEVTATARVETDAGGDGDLEASDFTLCETFGGDNFGQDPIVTFAGENEAVEADVIIVIDTSGSMGPPLSPQEKFDSATAGAKTLVNALGPGVNIGLVEFTEFASLETPLTSNHTVVKNDIDGLSPGGGTDIGSGIDKAQTELDDNGRDVPTFMVVLGNGDTSGGEPPATNAKNKGTTIYGIAYGSGASTSDFEDLVGEVPNDPDWLDFAFDADQDDITSIFENIGEIISGTYALTYETCNPEPTSFPREVLVHVDDPSGVATDTEDYTLPST